jgi:hypothetical protein
MASLLKQLRQPQAYKAQADDKPPLRPKAVLLDVNGTLFAITAAAAPAFKQLGLHEGLVEVCVRAWLRGGMAAWRLGCAAAWLRVRVHSSSWLWSG